MITASVMAAMMLSFITAYGKKGFPWCLRTEYSRRYCSRSRLFTGGFSAKHRPGLPSEDRGRRHAKVRSRQTGVGWAERPRKSSDLLREQVLLLGLEPRRRRGAELGDQVEMGEDQRHDQ